MATVTVATLLGSLVAPVSVAIAAGPDYSRIWSPPNTALPKTASVKGQKAAPVAVAKPAHPVPPVWQPPKSSARPIPGGHASVQLGAVSGESAASGLPVTLAPLAGSAVAGQSVQVDVADAKSTAAAGISGLAVTLTRTGKGDAGAVRLAVDASSLDGAFGANWASRARLVLLPDCSVTAPQISGCLKQTPIASHYDPSAKKIVADVTLPGNDGAVHTSIQALSATASTTSATVGVVSGSSSGSGTYAATPLGPSQAWAAGGSSGSFTYTYPVQTPPALGGSAPGVSLGYDSSSVDGKTSSTNSQASWIGDGWDYNTGFVERSYKPCSQDGIANSGDECWAGANLTLSLAGHSGELVPDDSSCQSGASAAMEQSNCTWRLKDDDGTKVQFLTGATNGTWNGSYLKVEDTSGTVFYFGLNHVPDANGNPTTLGADSGSAWTVPVYSPNSGDPCYDPTKGQGSWCQTAWRWNLDFVVDPHGNLTTYGYTPEANFYARGGAQNGGNGSNSSYTRGGVLASIGYGQLLSDQLGSNGSYNPAAKVLFTVAERCVTSTAACDPSQRTIANAANWPDVPVDQQCDSTSTCSIYGPTFWTTKWLTNVTTQVRVKGAYQTVDSYALNHQFINVQNATENTQVPWLASVQRTGQDTGASSTPITLPPVSFTSMLLPNRVDGSNLVPAPPAYNRPRIQLITTETGSTIGVNYASAACSRVNNVMPASADSDTLSCYNVKWNPSGSTAGATPVDDWFLKYPVTSVTSNPNTPGVAPMTTTYAYGNAAWHRNDSPLTQDNTRTWDQFRGYASVTTVTGSGADGPQSQKSTTYYQGMDGDLLAGGGTRSVSAAGPMSGSVTDSDWLSGETLESDTYTQAGGTVTGYTVNTASGPVTTATHGRGSLPALIARYTATSSVSASKSLKADGTWRSTSRTSTTDSAHGNRVVTSLDSADGLPDVCTRTNYAAGSDPQVSALIDETVSVYGTGACTATPTASNTSVWSRVAYDGQPFGQLGSTDNPTSTLSLDHFDTSGNPQFSTSTATFDGYGRATSATDPNSTDSAHSSGATVTTAYSAGQAGELPTSVAVTTPAPAGASDVLTGRTTTTTYDPARSLTLTVTDPNGRIATEAYDALGRVTGVWAPGRATTSTANQTFAYTLPGVVNGNAVPPTVTTSRLLSNGTSYAVSIQIMDGLGRTVQTQSTPAVSAYTGRLISDTGYDSHGRVIRANSTWYNNDTAPSTTLFPTTTQQVPAQTYTVYDGLGRPLTSQFVAYGVVQSTTTTAYPGADRTDVTPPAGATPTSSVTDARGHTTQLWQYKTASATGNPGDADVTTYTYTVNGQVATQKDAAGNTWTHGYDLRGREVAATDPDAGTSSKTYDPAGRVASTLDARGQTIDYSYDLLGRVTGTYSGSISPANQLTGFTYDTVLKGQPSTSTRYVNGASGSAYTNSVLTYDTAYHPTKTTISIPGSEIGATSAFTYTYQAAYDAITGELKADNRSAVGDIAAETVNYTYDIDGPLTTFGAFGGSTYDLSSNWDAYGRNTRSTMNPWGTQIVVTNTYDESTGRPLQQFVDKQTAATGSVQQNTYTYNPAGQITAVRSIPDNIPSSTDLQCFGYDYLGRLSTAWTDTGSLTQAAQPTVGGIGSCANSSPTSGAQAPARTTVGGPAAYWESFGYDLTGNRTQAVQHDPSGDTTKDTTVTQTFQPAGTVNTPTSAQNTGGGTGGPHGLMSSTTTAPTGTTGSSAQYDAVGNTTSVTDTSGTATLNWDAEGKLSSYSKTGTAGPTTYLYDASGKQLIRRDPGKTTITLGGDELVYTPGTNPTGVRYYQIPGGITLVRQGGKSTYQINDPHGTGTLALDGSTLTETREVTDPFGNTRGTQPTGWAGDHGYVGGTKDDATGLTNLGAREYQPLTGRFLSPDPIIGIGSPQQWNGYAYSNNDPVNQSDPSGLYTCRNGHEGCNAHGNPCGEDNKPGVDGCSAENTMTGDCVDTECSHSEVNQNPEHTIAEQHQARINKTIKDISDYYDYTHVKKCNYNMKVPQCWTKEQSDQEEKFSKQLAGALGDLIPGVPEVRCTFTGDDHECDVAGAAVSTMDVGAVGVGGEETALALRSLLAKVSSGEASPVMQKLLQKLAAVCKLNSFPGETEVRLGDGSAKPIQDVHVGDVVTATDPETGLTRAEHVTGVVKTLTDSDFTDLALDAAGSRTLTSTQQHPYWDATTQRWTDAAAISVGDELRQADGSLVRVSAVHNYVKPIVTYNLTVAELHTYYVLAGATPVLVHNSSWCGPQLAIDSTQFGKKWGKHSKDFGLDVKDPELRNGFEGRVRDAWANPDEVRIGEYNPNGNGGDAYIFARSGKMIVLAKPDGEFVSVLNTDIGNGWWDRAPVVHGG